MTVRTWPKNLLALGRPSIHYMLNKQCRDYPLDGDRGVIAELCDPRGAASVPLAYRTSDRG